MRRFIAIILTLILLGGAQGVPRNCARFTDYNVDGKRITIHYVDLCSGREGILMLAN